MDWTIILLIISIFLSSFFSGAEVALVSMTELKVRHLAEHKVKNASFLLYLKKRPSKTLITILIGNNIVNIGGSALATKIAIDAFSNAGIGIATGVMTFLILTFGEIMPKTLASKHAKNFALTISPIIYLLMKVLYPFVWLFHHMSRGAHLLVKTEENEPLITEQEVKDFVDIGEEVGQIKPDEKEMIKNIFAFDDTKVEDVMTPRTDMFALESDMLLKEALPVIIDHDFSRVPIYEERLDSIKGILFVRDLLELASKGDLDRTLGDICKPALFVPETQKIDSLLRDLQEKKIHIAMVVDEHGGIEGLITIEDILEELVGEIFDESDEVEKLITEHGKHRWLVLGKTPIDVINEELGLSLPERDDYHTLSGFIQDRLGRVPDQGEELKLPRNGLRLIIKHMEGPIILEVELHKT